MHIRLRYFSFLFVAAILLTGAWGMWEYYNPPEPTLSFLTDEPWSIDTRLSGMDHFRYLFYAVAGRYAEYAWAVRTSYAIVLTCCIAVLMLSVIMGYDVVKRRKKTRHYQKLQQQYGQVLRNLAKSENRMAEPEIAQSLQTALSTPWNYDYKLLWIDLFTEVRIESDVRNEGLANLQQAMQLLGLTDFMEKRLIQGKDRDKLRIIQAVRLLEMPVADSVMARLVNHRNRELRKAARIYYMLVNRDNPYRFFEQDEIGGDLLPWDRLELHQLFADCMAREKRLPSFVPLMERSQNPALISFLILETAYWGHDEEIGYLTSYFQASHPDLRKAAFQAMGIRRYHEAEKELQSIFYAQTEELRRIILHSLLQIHSGESIHFFGEAYRKSASDQTRLSALACLWLSGTEGQANFHLLEKQAPPEEQTLFNHVSNARTSLLNHLI